MPDAFARAALMTARPSVWAREVLHFDADAKQIELLDCDALDTLIVWARQSGKTETVAAIISHFAVHQPKSLTVVTSATWRQGSIVTGRILSDLRTATGEQVAWHQGQAYEWPEQDIFGNVKIVRSSVMSLALSNQSQVIAVPPSPDSARGYSPDLLCVDEASRTRDSLWHAVSPMRAAKKVRLIAMTTAASEAGWFYKMWTDDPDVWKSEYTAAECPRISAEFLRKEQRRLPAFIFEAEYNCRWYPRAGRLFSDAMIANMMVADGEAPENWTPGPLVGGESW